VSNANATSRLSAATPTSSTDEALLESLMIQIWAIYRGGGDHDLGAAVAAQMNEVCNRLPAQLAQATLVRYGFVDDTDGRR
jgi:hypothetical protein